MLYTPGNSFLAAADNYGSTYTVAALGTAITSHATTAHTKNASITTILAAQTFDIYGIAIGFQFAGVSTVARRFLTDIFVDPSGGTSWESTPRIADLASENADLTLGMMWYYFPLFIKNGTSIGARCQSETAAVTQRILIKVIGSPTRPDLAVVGTRVKTFGATTASTSGTAYTPGTNAMGSNSASLGTLADNIFWWQFGFMTTDASMIAQTIWSDVLCGNGTNNIVVLENIPRVVVGTAETGACPSSFGTRLPQCFMPSGNNVYIRAATIGTPDSTCSGIVYGVAA